MEIKTELNDLPVVEGRLSFSPIKCEIELMKSENRIEMVLKIEKLYSRAFEWLTHCILRVSILNTILKWLYIFLKV